MHHKIIYPTWFVLPSLLIFATLYLFPAAFGFVYSLTDWNAYRSHITFVGMRQYVDLFASHDIIKAFSHTLIYALIVSVFQNGLGFFLALILNSKLPAKNVFRTLFFLPCILSALVIGYMFSALLHPEGLLNEFFNLVGLGSLRQEWLGNADIAIFSVSFVNVWQWAGFSMAIYLAGLQGMPKELLEASVIDGCGYWERLRKIVIPLIAPSITINIILCLIGSLKVFELVYVLTGGGPGVATEVVNTFIYKQFSQGLYAYGTAANVCLFVIIALISFTVLFFLRKREVEL